MQSDYKDLEKLAREKEEENWGFRKFLKFYDELSDKELDQFVSRIAGKYESEIECISCGRCCKKLKPTFSQQDQQRLADRLMMTVEQLRPRHLEYDESDNKPGWQMKGTPCPFQKDNKCTVYEDRPQDCQGYPYLHEPGFSGRTMGMIERTFTCPIVFNVMEELKKELHFEASDGAEDF
ncbi:YkgJ family cysteine cluster protein [Planctomycetota bacterium]